MPAVSTHHCAACGDERPFEQPPCVDGHGDLCPELACVVWGSAILLGLLGPLVTRPAGSRPAESRPPAPALVVRPPVQPVRAA